MLSPIGFWHFMGLEAGGDTVIATFYGGVFFAVGVLCLLGLRDPFRYSIVLLFMGIYKSVSFLVLMARAASLLGAPEGLPLGGVVPRIPVPRHGGDLQLALPRAGACRTWMIS